MLKSIEKLKTDAWRTAGARYNAARRLKRRNLFATISVSLFAVVGVGLVVVQKTYNTPPGSPLDNYLTALSACLSVFLLVVNLIEWGAGNSVKADRLHQNAEELNAFWRKVDLEILKLNSNLPFESQASEMDSFLREYSEIKAKCYFNHDPIDDDLFVAIQWHASEFKINEKAKYGWWKRHWIRFLSFASSVWYFIMLWFVIAVLIFGIYQSWPQSQLISMIC